MNQNRLDQIEKILRVQKQASVLELASLLKVSDMTIRRDLNVLESQGKVNRYFGGASISPELFQKDDLPAYHPDQCVEEKRRIGKAGRDYLRSILLSSNPASISLLSGTTVLEMVNAIDFTIPASIITDNLKTTQVLAQNAHNNIIMLGGKVSLPSLNLVGYFAERTLESLTIEYTFTGMAGIDFDGNLYCYDEQHASVLRRLLRNSNHIIVLADHSKIGFNSMVRITQMDNSYMLLTDTGADKACLQNYRKMGIEVMLCE